MTLELAEGLTAKLIANGMQSEVSDLFADPETVIHDTLVEIGEEAPPPPQPPSSVQELVKSIERCFQDGLTQLEILNLCDKAVIG
jgi:hypothetical protein